MPVIRWLGWAGAAALCVTASVARGSESDEAVRARMREVYASFREVLPLLADPHAERAKSERQRIEAALAGLAERSSLLDDHEAGLDPGARFVARGLGEEVSRARHFYAAGEAEAASYSLSQATDRCIGCHSRLPDEDDSSVASGLFETSELAGLSPLSRAALQVATRRFDEALTTYEAALTSSDVAALDLLPPLLDYLVVSVRVKGELLRPLPTLRAIASREDAWRRLREDLDRWSADLERYAARKPAETLAEARSIIEAGQRSIELPSDRRALVHYLVASRVLHRRVAAIREPGPELAETYYWLGLVETRLGRSFWASPASFYLEQAVRLAPGSPTARQAFALLEEETLFGFSGSGGTFLPADERARLSSLEKLARGAPAPAPAASP
jgi:tetratricopeptide (TPR) repeat protein